MVSVSLKTRVEKLINFSLQSAAHIVMNILTFGSYLDIYLYDQIKEMAAFSWQSKRFHTLVCG